MSIPRPNRFGNRDHVRTAQQYVDWARGNLHTFADGVHRELLAAQDSRTQDKLLVPLLKLLSAEQSLGGRSR